MATWYPGSGLTWQQYLQASAFVGDLRGDMARHSREICARLQEDSAQQVGTLQQLDRTFFEGMESVATAIDQLGARFDYSMGLVLDELHVQSTHLEAIVRELDSIKRTLQSPLLTQARELFRLGCDRLAKGLLDKAVEAFLEAEKKNDTDYFTEYFLGKLYLYGKDEDDDVIDLHKAKHHLLAAARYGKAEISENHQFKRLTAESLFHASIACLALSDGARDERGEQLKQASALVKDALHLAPSFSEAWFHAARFKALAGRNDKSIAILEAAILRDRRYAARALVDGAFTPLRPEVRALLERLRQSTKREAEAAMGTAAERIAESEAHPFVRAEEGRQFHERAVAGLDQARLAAETGTYLGLLEAIEHARQAAQNARDSLGFRIRAQEADRVAEQQRLAAEKQRRAAAVARTSVAIGQAFAWVGLLVGAAGLVLPAGPLAFLLGVAALKRLPREGWEHHSDRLRAGWAVGLGIFGSIALAVALGQVLTKQ